MKRDTFEKMTVFLISLGLSLTPFACLNSSMEAQETGSTAPVTPVVKIEAIVPSSLGPSFSIITEKIAGRPYGFLGSAAGIVVLEMSDATHPSEVASLLTAGAPQGLFLLGNYLFAAGGDP